MLRSWNLNLSITKSSGIPVYLQITQQIIDEIQRGRLTAATAMPGTRELAKQLQVNRKTIMLAYDELVAQGWLMSQDRRGTFVSKDLPHFAAPKETAISAKPPTLQSSQELDAYATIASNKRSSDTIEFNDGVPDTRLIPVETLSKAFRRALITPLRSNNLGYHDPKGSPELRAAIQEMVCMERGLNVTADNICIARGSQMGIFLAARILTQPDDIVVVENLSYPPAREAFRSCGATIKSVAVDDDGIDVVALEALCQQHPIRAVYVTPHHQFPTTVMMTAERRLKLLWLAKQYDFLIIEDDYDHEFHFEHHPVLPLASHDHHERVIYIGSLSKVLAPGLRIGYLIASKAIIDRCASEVMLIDRQGNAVTELAAAQLMASGEIKRHIRKTIKVYVERRDLTMQLLSSELSHVSSFKEPDGGLAIWLNINDDINLRGIVDAALEANIHLLPAYLFSTGAEPANALRLGFASLNTQELTQGIQQLKTVFDQHA